MTYFERVTLTMTFDLLLNIGNNIVLSFCNRLGVHIWHISMCYLGPELSNGAIDFKHVTLTVNFTYFCKIYALPPQINTLS